MRGGLIMVESNTVKDVSKKKGNKREDLLTALQEIVKNEKFLSENRLLEVAREFDLAPAEVYGVATFYSFLPVRPVGENVIKVCQTIVCDIKGKDVVLKAIKDKLKIVPGQTSEDGKFSLLTVNCIGQCENSPAMIINDKPYANLTYEKVFKIIDEYQS
jgi:NADH-quinone oxidoreductase subunit E